VKIFVSPKEWSHATDRFDPDHMVSLQDPDADLNDLRPHWINEDNHFVGLFYDCDTPGHAHAPTNGCIREVIDWLKPRCACDSEHQFVIHCDAGLGRSPAIGYIAWALHYGPGNEEKAFKEMQNSCFKTQIIPNTIIVRHADNYLKRKGELSGVLTNWNYKVTWRRTFR
jgi:predicted protein tyrosine phosphatase